MKALSVRQPWAELIARGEKTVEVRSWATSYRGPLLICAGAAWHPLGVKLHGRIGARGAAVCVVQLVDCRPITAADSDAAKIEVDESHGYAWVLESPVRVEPIELSGRLGLFTPPQEAIRPARVA